MTVPPEALTALGLRPGDAVMIIVQGGEIVLGRADDPFVNPFAAFTEWAGEEDCRAFKNL